jgi:hypothetical protein
MNMETTVELKQYLKALRLSPLLDTLPERVAYPWRTILYGHQGKV